MCDSCIYVKSDNLFKVLIVLYVDDLLVTESSEVGFSKTKASLITHSQRRTWEMFLSLEECRCLLIV